MAPGSDITGAPWHKVTRQELIDMGYGVLDEEEDITPVKGESIHLVGGIKTLLIITDHPDIFTGDTDAEYIDLLSNVDCDIHAIDFGRREDLVEYKPEAWDIDKNQSWQQMNRGKMSKKQRRK